MIGRSEDQRMNAVAAMKCGTIMIELKDTELKEWQNSIAEDELFAPLVALETPASYNPRYKDNTIVNLTFQFAQGIWDLAEELQEKRKFVVANQVFRSGTKIALKEADETEYWLLLCISRKIGSARACLDDLRPIVRVLNKIISTSKARKNNAH